MKSGSGEAIVCELWPRKIFGHLRLAVYGLWGPQLSPVFIDQGREGA